LNSELIKKSDIDQKIAEYKALTDNYLERFLKAQYPEILWESMKYTSLSKGKRIRPAIVLESTAVCGGNTEDAIATACAVEMVHAQSLIHDDLPCMDNDDFRRGQPTNHKKYGEAIAVLAGDALLAYAPSVIIKYTPDSVSKVTVLKVLDEFLSAAGPLGLIGGQTADIISENKVIDAETLYYIHTNKTGRLFEFCAKAGALISKASADKIEALSQFGKLTGYAFQIADDILDIISNFQTLGKTPGKDEKSEKNTYPKLFGMDKSIEQVNDLCLKAKAVLKDNRLESPFLSSIADNIALKVKQNDS
jgi:geranylgeranyl diphosphate synthase type II